MIRHLAALIAASCVCACASAVNTVEGGPSAQGFIRVRSEFNFYTLVIQAYDAETERVLEDVRPLGLRHPPSFWRSADPNAYRDYFFEAVPGTYVLRAIEFSYGNRSGKTCIDETFAIELVEGRNNYVGSYAVTGPGRRPTYAELSREDDALEDATAAFRASSETDEPLTLSAIQPAVVRGSDCRSGLSETMVFFVPS